MPVFFIVILGLYIAGSVYIFLRGRKAIQSQSAGVKALLSILFWAGVTTFPISMFLREAIHSSSFFQFYYEMGFGWLVFTLYLVLLLLLFDLLRLFRLRCPSFVSFYTSLGITLAVLFYGYYNYIHPDVRVVPLTIDKPLEGVDKTLRIVAFSDVHLGHGTGKAKLRKYVDLVNAQQADLILIGGDLVDNSLAPLEEQRMEEELATLYAPLGVYMVPGNHDYFDGIEKNIEFLEQTSIVLLRDSIAVLPNGLQLVGRDDRRNRNRHSLDELVKKTDPGRPVILIDHQPYELIETEKAGVDLQFSGHTHRGQIWPISLIADQMFEMSYGYRKMGGSHIYVSSGLSLWGPPFRIGTDSEIVLFELTFK
ncbi:metallophosphoesterase [Parabacteroides sp. PF5-9]|uniref:metallophosphoesterase n=1 Tax=Parabacteroides sp. PF5-9 TaxID=1742404 RepID=UPI0024771B92|nr:metallophosphoesterase [Parabacteroides sp. PF5-9]MDH6359187.1 putative MPP superfamily phosphohydrolase [Parabacteroides sp. PF5-9]